MVFYVANSQSDIFSISYGENIPQDSVDHVSLRIITPDWTIEYVDVSTKNTTVADLLFECADHYDIPFDTEYWDGYNSYLIDSINNTSNGIDGRFWQFYVNDQYADVGCSNYYLKNYDQVEWRFVSSHFQETD